MTGDRFAKVADQYFVKYGRLGFTIPEEWVGHASTGDVVCCIFKHGRSSSECLMKLDSYATSLEKEAYTFAADYLKKQRSLTDSDIVTFEQLKWVEEE